MSTLIYADVRRMVMVMLLCACVRVRACVRVNNNKTGHTSIVKLLSDNGADIDKKTNDDGDHPIWIASQNGECNGGIQPHTS